jgi:sigma-B regulation protein RsbU (phosphoserine phosphatase)
MKILVIEDDLVTNRMLGKNLTDLGFDVIAAFNGLQGWETYCREDIHIVITDWMMPEMNGLEVLKKIRERDEKSFCYIILLTAKNNTNDVIEGIASGADEYIIKPFDKEELAVRVRAAQRIVELQQELLETNKEQKELIIELEDALSKIRQLSGLLPICSYCKKIRDDQGSWNQLEVYISAHSETEFSHGICPECVKKVFPELNRHHHNSS